jgi:hypothetical protein
MNFWIFKVSDKGKYPDVAGKTYVFDNTHSIRVRVGDEFIYLAKTGAKYHLTGAGCVSKVCARKPTLNELHSPRVTRVFEAELNEVVWFTQPFDISSQTKEGVFNRRRAGLPDDVNTIGWSLSMPRVDRELFKRLLDVTLDRTSDNASAISDLLEDGRVDDAWSLVRQRCRLQAFRTAVLARHNFTCLVCGTRLRSVLDAAHLRSYASDPDHRANPKNGICLCKFCHAAFDCGDIRIFEDGTIEVDANICDDIARAHFEAVDSGTRKQWLCGVQLAFITERCVGSSK